MAKKVIAAISTLLCCLVLVLAFAAGFALLNSSERQPPSVFGFSPMVVVSGSMEPELPVGTFIVSRKVTPSQVKERDVIVFYGTVGSTTGIITHRVIEVHGEGDSAMFTTMGDANSIPDPYYVEPGNLLGKVVFESPLLGKIISPLRIPALRPVLFALPVLLVVWEAFSVLKGKKNAADPEDADENDE